MKKYILGVMVSIGVFISPAFTQAAGLTTQQATSLIGVVQSAPGVPASAFVNLITSFSNITVNQATSLIAVVQSAPNTSASIFVPLLTSFTSDTSATQTTTSPTVSCGNGNDYYDGGDGIDTLTYAGKRSDFVITQNANGSYTFKDTVPCRAGTDTVINTEQFYFADGLYTLQTLHPDFVDQSTFQTSVPVISSLTASPTQINQGQSTELSWSSSGANSCRLIANGDGLYEVPENVDRKTFNPQITTIYRVTCGTKTSDSQGGYTTTNEISKEVTVTVVQASTASLKINSIYAGNSDISDKAFSSKKPITFQWSSAGIDSSTPIKVYLRVGLGTINIGQIYSNGNVQTTTVDPVATVLAPFPESLALLQTGMGYLILRTKTLDISKYADAEIGPFQFVVE